MVQPDCHEIWSTHSFLSELPGFSFKCHHQVKISAHYRGSFCLSVLKVTNYLVGIKNVMKTQSGTWMKTNRARPLR